MTDKQINLAIAEACGWKPTTDGGICWDCNGSPIVTPPNYANDLNAMHEAEKLLDDVSYDSYWNNLVFVCIQSNTERLNSATARQRAEAFLRTLGKWEEVKP